VDREKRLASKRRYRQSAKGKKTIARYMKAYRKTENSLAAQLRYYEKRKNDPLLRAKWKENFLRWLKTAKGQAYWKRHNLELPALTPEGFLKSLSLFYLLKEIANEHN
jgi:hypothetical protein